MIEVNLLPGGKKKRPSKRGGGGGGGGGGFLKKFSMPALGSLSLDVYTIASVVVVAGVLGVLGWWYMGLSSRQDDVQVELADALQDSANYADLIARNATLAARRDSIAQKVAMIQEIDADRYVWAHLLDEVARALPDFTWLTQVIQVAVADVIDFRVVGLAGNNNAMTSYLRRLEESPFIRNVQLVQAESVLQQSGEIVVQFQFDCVYSRPPMDFLETVPLFAPDLQALQQ